MKKCPKCGCESFYVTAHVTQDWKVDCYGDFIECMDDCVEVTHHPDDEDMWECANCSYNAEGKEFNVIENKEENKNMTIKRTINGKEVEIELTAEEIRNIYYAEHDAHTLEDIQSRYKIPEGKEQLAVDAFEDALGMNDNYWDSYWMMIEYAMEELGFEEADEE